MYELNGMSTAADSPTFLLTNIILHMRTGFGYKAYGWSNLEPQVNGFTDSQENRATITCASRNHQ